MILSRLTILKNYASLFFDALRWVGVKKGGGFLNSGALNTRYLLHLFYKKDYIFVHINKTGGSSIEKALGDTEQVHLSAYTLKNHLGTQEYNSKFKFAFVRNPYDRIVSQYHYRLQNNQTDLKSGAISFKEWVIKTYVQQDESYYNYPAMFQSQVDWLSDPEGVLLVDFVGRFENLQKDFSTVCEKLKIANIELPHNRKSKREKNYMEYYDDETLKIISEKFHKDFEYFGYKKQG